MMPTEMDHDDRPILLAEAEDAGLTQEQTTAYLFFCESPGRDSRDLSEHMAISGKAASDLTEVLLSAGLLDFAD